LPEPEPDPSLHSDLLDSLFDESDLDESDLDDSDLDDSDFDELSL